MLPSGHSSGLGTIVVASMPYPHPQVAFNVCLVHPSVNGTFIGSLVPLLLMPKFIGVTVEIVLGLVQLVSSG